MSRKAINKGQASKHSKAVLKEQHLELDRKELLFDDFDGKDDYDDFDDYSEWDEFDNWRIENDISYGEQYEEEFFAPDKQDFDDWDDYSDWGDYYDVNGRIDKAEEWFHNQSREAEELDKKEEDIDEKVDINSFHFLFGE
jgi:hypothetical protein